MASIIFYFRLNGNSTCLLLSQLKHDSINDSKRTAQCMNLQKFSPTVHQIIGLRVLQEIYQSYKIQIFLNSHCFMSQLLFLDPRNVQLLSTFANKQKIGGQFSRIFKFNRSTSQLFFLFQKCANGCQVMLRNNWENW